MESPKGDLTGVPSGFPRLDGLTGGWQPGDLILVAARRPELLTSFALNCAIRAATVPRYLTGVALFSFRISAMQMTRRLLAAEARVEIRRLRTGHLRDEDWQRLARASGKFSETCMFIDDVPGLSALGLSAKARRLKKACQDFPGIGFVVVDGLQQLCDVTAAQWNSCAPSAAKSCLRALKTLALELQAPVLACARPRRYSEGSSTEELFMDAPAKRSFPSAQSAMTPLDTLVREQLDRATDQQALEPRLRLRSLRAGGFPEEEADTVLLINHPGFRRGTGDPTRRVARITVARQRRGRSGTVRLVYAEEFGRFESRESSDS